MSFARLRGDLRRRERQAQGMLENAAVRDHLAVRKQRPETLPATVEALLASGPRTPLGEPGVVDRWLMRNALRAVTTPRDWSRCGEPAALLHAWIGA